MRVGSEWGRGACVAMGQHQPGTNAIGLRAAGCSNLALPGRAGGWQTFPWWRNKTWGEVERYREEARLAVIRPVTMSEVHERLDYECLVNDLGDH